MRRYKPDHIYDVVTERAIEIIVLALGATMIILFIQFEKKDIAARQSMSTDHEARPAIRFANH